MAEPARCCLGNILMLRSDLCFPIFACEVLVLCHSTRSTRWQASSLALKCWQSLALKYYYYYYCYYDETRHSNKHVRTTQHQLQI